MIQGHPFEKAPKNNPHANELSLDFEGEAKRLEDIYGIQNPPNKVILSNGGWYVDGLSLDNWIEERRETASRYNIKIGEEKTLTRNQKGEWFKDGIKLQATHNNYIPPDDDAQPRGDQYWGKGN